MKRKLLPQMNHKYILFIFLMLCSLGQVVLAQESSVSKCVTPIYDQLNAERYPGWQKQREAFEKQVRTQTQRLKRSTSSKTTRVVLKIPVVVHIIHNETDGGIRNANIPDQQVYDQIAVLNEDYRRTNTDATNTPALYSSIASDIEVEFCLANRDPNGAPTSGINRVYNAKSPFIYPTDDALIKGLSYWPSDQYLNIWVCRINYGTQKLLGYAQFPSNSSLGGLATNEGPAVTDGVVIHYTVFGRNVTTDTQYNLGRTATHEVGHWLGLLHTWGDEADCSGNDFCADVPDCSGEYYSDKPTCIAPIQCGHRRMIENYMDYSDDACMNLFTADQKTRMHSAISISPRRIALNNSKGCCDTCTFDTDLVVFPNPVYDGKVNFKIEFSDPTSVKIVIYDRIGRKIYEQESEAVVRYNKYIDVSTWTNGIYYIVVDAGDKNFVRREIVIN